MEINKSDNINVYNYGSSAVVFPIRRDKQILLEPAQDGKPSMTTLIWDELEYADSNSCVVEDGLVRFLKEIEDAIYKSLRKENWKDILFDDVIEDIILNPTQEKLQRIIDVRKVLVIERVKGILTSLKNTGRYDISNRVESIVNKRRKEIIAGQLKSTITPSPKDIARTASADDVEKLKSQNAELHEKLASMEAMLAKLVDENKSTKDDNSDVIELIGNTAEAPKKSPGKSKSSN